jgi:hypothetical protein
METGLKTGQLKVAKVATIIDMVVKKQGVIERYL